jgi:hypothetical protein
MRPGTAAEAVVPDSLDPRMRGYRQHSLRFGWRRE